MARASTFSPSILLLSVTRRDLISKAKPYCWMGLASLVIIAGCKGPKNEPVELLQLGDNSIQRMAYGQNRRFAIDFTNDGTIRVEIDQQHIDVAIRVIEPSGEELFTFDTDTGTYVPERFCFSGRKLIPEGKKSYFLEVFALSGSGPITIKLQQTAESRSGTPSRGELCAEATLSFVAAQSVDAWRPEGRPAHLERAAELWGRSGEPTLAALAFRDAGTAWYDLNLSGRAIGSFESGLEIIQGLDDSYLRISLLNRLGLAQLERGLISLAGATLNRALDLARRSGDAHGEASALLNLGRFDSTSGDPHRAIRRYQQSLPIWDQLGSLPNQAQALLNLADAYGLLDRHQEALDALDDAQVLVLQSGDKRREADILSAQAWLHYLSGSPAVGVPLMRRALALRRQLGNRNGEASTLNRLGTLLEAGEELETAEKMFREALDLSIASNNPADIAANRASLGCLYHRMERYTEAREELGAVRQFLDNRDDPKALSHTEYCLAQLARDSGDLDVALGHIKEALDIVEQIRETARPQGYRYRPIWLWQDYSQLQIELLVAKYRSTGRSEYLYAAFEESDLDRARNLYELVVESHLAQPSATSRQLAQERELQERLNRLALQRLAYPSKSNGDLDLETTRKIRALGVELDRLQAEIRARTPGDTHGLPSIEAPHPLPVSELTQLLDDETLLLAYDLGESESILFAVDKDGLRVFDLRSRVVLEKSAEVFYNALVRSANVEGQWMLTGANLSDQLIPAEAIRPHIKRLLVVAEGMLHYVPFAALPLPVTAEEAEEPSHQSVSDFPLLVDRYEIVNLPSAAIFAALRARQAERQPKPKSLAIFADPVYSISEVPTRDSDPMIGTANPDSSAQMSRSISARRLPGGDLPRLPWTTYEARTIVELFGENETLLRLGFEASKQAVTEADLEHYRFLHFATHARIDEELPELSSLVLSALDEKGRQVDGELRLHEIYRMHLAADLTVLSGCQTALGRRVRGDGLLGLTRGFFYAGSSRLIVSLWPVEDRATAHLMPRFYESLLRQNTTPAEALQEAQQWMRGNPEWRAPYYWASFILQGDF